MFHREETLARLRAVPQLQISQDVPLSDYTRFGIGGPASLYAESSCEQSFMDALKTVRELGIPHVVIGGGTNLIVADAGFDGLVLRFTANEIESECKRVHTQAGAVLQDLVDFTIDLGLRGIETMTGIPGSVGAAIYGNAGAYGHSVSERASSVRFFDGEGVRAFNNAECRFAYRESIFKQNKNWIIFSCDLAMDSAESGELRSKADGILTIRNEKYPPTMKCAGSIFKNLILTELPATVQTRVPEKVIREGKVPSAYFLEQVGAKGLARGDIRVADYHANLIYNSGHGTAADLVEVIRDLKTRVRNEFQFDLEEEVQYVGFNGDRQA